MTATGNRWSIGFALTLLTSVGVLLVAAFRVGQSVQQNTRTLRAVASHICRVEAHLKMLSYPSCFTDIIGSDP